jgi:KDO2-lipid IV(A) lauroyltransferase
VNKTLFLMPTASAATTKSSLWRPSNLLAALGVLLLRIGGRLPLSVSRGFGAALGTLVYWVYPFRKSVAETNLRLCFPEMDATERRKLLKAHYRSMGMGMFEMAFGWYAQARSVGQHVDIRGLEHIEAVKASGRGALLMTAHFTTLEICGRFLNERFKFSCLYRKPNQPIIAKEMTRCRLSRMERVIHFNETQDLIRALRDGAFVWYAPDQGKRLKYSSILPFFGVPAITNTATGRIARMGRAAIIPFVGYRTPEGRYVLEIFPELTDVPSKDPEADAIRINHLIEDFIRRAPDQYFWLHKRFKARGPEYPDVYAKPTRAAS